MPFGWKKWFAKFNPRLIIESDLQVVLTGSA
jgi:hypothetical protein